MDQTTTYYTLGIDIGSTTVKVALLDQDLHIIFSDYERHYANIQETLAGLLKKALNQTGPIDIIPVITGSGGLTLSSHLHITYKFLLSRKLWQLLLLSRTTHHRPTWPLS